MARYKSRRKPRSTGTSALFHTVWITTAGLVLFDVNNEGSTIKAFFTPKQVNEAVIEQVQGARIFNKPAAKAAAPSDHVYFGEEEAQGVAQNEAVTAPPANSRLQIEGLWTAAVEADDVYDVRSVDNCSYEIRSLDFELKSDGEHVRGHGSYTMVSEDCPGDERLTEYASVTGTMNKPYIKLNIKNNNSQKVDLVYYGTVRPEGIVGQVRSGFGELLAEHVTLVQR